MPQLPVYNSNRNIQPTTGQPLRNESAASFEAQNNLLKTATGIAQKWSDANDVMQYTEAKANYEVATTDIQARAATDPNYKDSSKYFKELDDAKKNNLGLIANQEVANKAALEFDMGNRIAQIKIGADFQQKQIKVNKFNTEQLVSGLQSKALAAPTPESANQYNMQIKQVLDANIASGVLSLDEADKLLKNAQNTSVKYEIYADQATTEKESVILSELKKAKGKYSFLEPEERLKLIEESQRRVFQNNQSLKKENELSQSKITDDIFSKATQGTLSLQDIDNYSKIPPDKGGLTPKEINTIKNNLVAKIDKSAGGIASQSSQAKTYLSAFEGFIKNDFDKQKAREYIVNHYNVDSKGFLPSEVQFLNKILTETDNIKYAEKGGFIYEVLKPAAESLSVTLTGRGLFTPEENAKAIHQLLEDLSKGKDAQESIKDIVNQASIESNPHLQTIPKAGKLMMDENGNIQMAIPDEKGIITFQDYKSKKAKETK
jgi:hypothetical protein